MYMYMCECVGGIAQRMEKKKNWITLFFSSWGLFIAISRVRQTIEFQSNEYLNDLNVYFDFFYMHITRISNTRTYKSKIFSREKY